MATAKCTDLTAREERTVYRAMQILEKRMREPLASFTSSGDTRRWLHLHIGRRDVEVFVGLFVDSRNRLIAWEDIATGTIDAADVVVNGNMDLTQGSC